MQVIQPLGITTAHGSEGLRGLVFLWDYQCLNDVTVLYRYPIPHIRDFSAHLAGMRVFLKVDLVQPAAAENIP